MSIIHAADDIISSMTMLSSKRIQRQINSSMKLPFSSSSSSSSSLIEETFRYRSLQSTDSKLVDQLAVVRLVPLPNENIHIASIQHNINENVVHQTTSSSPYQAQYSTILSKSNHIIQYMEDSLCSGCG